MVTDIPDRRASLYRKSGRWRLTEQSAQVSLRRELSRNPFVRIKEASVPVRATNVIIPDMSAPARQSCCRATWLGHATILVQLKTADGIFKILFDPIFSERASPLSFIGPRRLLEPPCQVVDLPSIDVVCLSHNHYDHLDAPTLQALHNLQPDILYCVPLGNGDVLKKIAIESDQIHELAWWEELHFHTCGCILSECHHSYLEVACTPAQHNSSRAIFDWNKSLWSSWVVRTRSRNRSVVSSVFFGGDTGYRAQDDGPVFSAFTAIAKRYGPFDLSFIPIWRGASLSFLSKFGIALKPESFTRSVHSTPKDAVDMHIDLKSKHSIAIHFGTFVGSPLETLQALEGLYEACQRKDIAFHQSRLHDSPAVTHASGHSSFMALDCGQSVEVMCE